MIEKVDYEKRNAFSHAELDSHVMRLCHLPKAGSFAVMLRKQGSPVQLLHHGLCNLPGDCSIYYE